jgi:hypothetical protein
MFPSLQVLAYQDASACDSKRQHAIANGRCLKTSLHMSLGKSNSGLG